MNKVASDEEWVEGLNAFLKKNISHSDSDKDERQQTVTRIFHGLYVVTTERY
jgi:hypothetical protein